MSLLAIEKLFREHFRCAVFTAQSIVLSREVAEDIVQNVFVKLLDVDLAALRSPSAFLYTCVRNAAHDHLRNYASSQRTIEQMSVSQEFAEVYGKNSDAVLPEESEHMKRLRRLSAAIEQLPPRTREVVKLVCLEGRSYREAAEDMCVSLSTVKAHMYQSFKMLRERIDSVGVRKPRPKSKKMTAFSIFFSIF